MKHLRKVMALVLAAVMALTPITPAFAADEVTTPQGNQTLDNAITVTGLEEGDKVDFYQVLKFDQNATTTGGWAKATGFTGLTDDEVKQILGLGDWAANGSQAANAGISAELAGRIGDMAESASAKYANVAAAKSGEVTAATQQSPDAGLYIGIIKPGKVGFVYNPVFVGADYKSNATNSVVAVMTDSYSPASMAKKAEITVDKTAEDATTVDENRSETVAVGDVVTFTIKTTIPEFGDNYTNPVFKVSDSLSTGLQLDTTSIEVYAGEAVAADKKLSDTASTPDYSLSPAATTSGFTVAFTESYIKKQAANQPVLITYKAKVTSAAATSVNQEKNTVTVNYSNSPTDNTGKGVLKDITNHYTFDIDANLLGETPYENTEVVKVGIDKDGNEITQTVTLDNGGTVGALQGAKFKLYKTQTGAQNETASDLYTNDILTADKYIESDGNGRLTIHGETTPGIRGLDAGVYWLKETEAPAGYVKAQDPVKIEIRPEFGDEKTYTETVTIDGVETTITYKAKELKSYKVFINDVETANYTMTNASAAESAIDSVTAGDTVVGKDGLIGATGAGTNAAAGKIQNKQGVELPSTGGMGTRILYTVGGAMIVAGGIYLVAKKRLSAME